MRYVILTAIALVCLMTSPSFAMWNYGGQAQISAHQQRGHAQRAMYASSYTGDHAYALAVSQGGPCGLVTERKIYGRSDHVLNGWNPWRSIEWAINLERAAPAPGMVAVWLPSLRTRGHVEPIASVNPDGTFNTDGSVGFRRVSPREVIVVDPRRQKIRGKRYAGV